MDLERGVKTLDTLKGESPKFKNVNTLLCIGKRHVCVCMCICVCTYVYIHLHALSLCALFRAGCLLLTAVLVIHAWIFRRTLEALEINR